ncbi:MAG: hypothetical protein EOO29_00885 [Comamonadaceae bacterium]|nr:MAG: hypothetical protein EOO29_00885 [Comamonadaceae bacterium]
MTPATAPCETTRLLPGQCLHTAVDAGSVLLVSEGRVRIDEAPRWLAGSSLPVGRTLGEGEQHVVTQSGWIAVSALGPRTGARLRQWLPAPPLERRPVWRFMRRLVGG